jgi:hypothetical protein
MIRLLEWGIFTGDIGSHSDIGYEEQGDINEEDPEKR